MYVELYLLHLYIKIHILIWLEFNLLNACNQSKIQLTNNFGLNLMLALYLTSHVGSYYFALSLPLMLKPAQCP